MTKREIKTWVGSSSRSRSGTIALNHNRDDSFVFGWGSEDKVGQGRREGERGSYIDPERVVVVLCVLPHLPCPN